MTVSERCRHHDEAVGRQLSISLCHPTYFARGAIIYNVA
jgi:hypothetical protein